jgi:glycosyltransferase involved in cell wall biosynthesis
VLVDPDKSKIFRFMIKFGLERAELITCDGENSKEAMIKLGEDSQKINIVYHGVDTKEFNPKQKDKKFREELEIFDSPTVISTRGLEPIYDVESLIKAIPLVLKQVPDAKFVIVNNGSQEAHLKELSKSLGIWYNVRFVGLVQHRELPKYLASSDVYVSTSLSDSFAVSTLEAMACGLAPVVTDVGDNRKWIKEEENGFVVSIKDPEALAEKIIYLLENEDIRKRFGKRNRKIIEEKGDYYKEMEKMESIYIGLVKRYKL